MYSQKQFNSFSKKCNNICENNTPKEAVEKMAKLKLPGSEKSLGKSGAIEVYAKVYVGSKVKYDIDKHKNNFSEFQAERCKYLDEIYDP